MKMMSYSFLVDVVLSVILIIISINNLKYYWFGAPGYNLFLLILNLIIIIFNIFSIIGYFSKHKKQCKEESASAKLKIFKESEIIGNKKL